MLKYIVVCRYCGTILFKTNDAIVGLLTMEIKCPGCKRLLKLSDDVIINIERKNKK